jgi:hypothetical protein
MTSSVSGCDAHQHPARDDYGVRPGSHTVSPNPAATKAPKLIVGLPGLHSSILKA